MDEIKVSTLNNQGKKLVGIKTTPTPGEGKLPTVILVHGFGEDKEESGMFTNLAQKFSEANFLSFRFDFSGCGESEGDYSETSLSKLKSDLAKILKFVHQEPEVDRTKIGILAQSFGTATTIALAPQVKCCLFMGSISHPNATLRELFGSGYHPQRISVRQKSDGHLTKIKPQLWQDFKNHNLLESVKKIHCPILFIHGSKDDTVPLSEMEAYYQRIEGPKEKIVIQGADHGLRPYRERAYREAVRWFKKCLA